MLHRKCIAATVAAACLCAGPISAAEDIIDGIIAAAPFSCSAQRGDGGWEHISTHERETEAVADCAPMARNEGPRCEPGYGYAFCGRDHRIMQLTVLRHLFPGSNDAPDDLVDDVIAASPFLCSARRDDGGWEYIDVHESEAEAVADCAPMARNEGPRCVPGFGYPYCGRDHRVMQLSVLRHLFPGSNDGSSPGSPGIGAPALVMGYSADPAVNVPLDGLTVSGSRFVYLWPDDQVDAARFFINGELVNVEGSTPFCLGPAPCPFDFDQLAPGSYTIRAEVLGYDGTLAAASAVVTVSGSGGEPTAPGAADTSLRWQAPATLADGVTPLRDLAGYRLYFGGQLVEAAIPPTANTVVYPARGCFLLAAFRIVDGVRLESAPSNVACSTTG